MSHPGSCQRCRPQHCDAHAHVLATQDDDGASGFPRLGLLRVASERPFRLSPEEELATSHLARNLDLGPGKERRHEKASHLQCQKICSTERATALSQSAHRSLCGPLGVQRVSVEKPPQATATQSPQSPVHMRLTRACVGLSPTSLASLESMRVGALIHSVTLDTLQASRSS